MGILAQAAVTSISESILSVMDNFLKVLIDGSSISVSGVFVAVGTAGSTDFARKLGAAVDDGRIIVDENFATNVPGVFAAGDCIGGLMQVSKAVGDGASAGINMIRYLKQI